jgi:hypothetical protein
MNQERMLAWVIGVAIVALIVGFAWGSNSGKNHPREGRYPAGCSVYRDGSALCFGPDEGDQAAEAGCRVELLVPELERLCEAQSAAELELAGRKLVLADLYVPKSELQSP